MRVALSSLLLAACAACSASPPEPAHDDPWDGVRSDELRRVGIDRARQLVVGTVTETASFTAWASMGQTPLGVTVISTVAGVDSPLQPGDVVVAVNDLEISMIEELQLVLREQQTGAMVRIVVRRTGRPDWLAMESLDEFPRLVLPLTVGR